MNTQGPVEINSQDNSKSDLEVIGVLYDKNNTVPFLSISLFAKFPNVNTLKVSGNQNLKEIKPDNLKGALKLKTLKVVDNLIVELVANLFVEAPNLENIVLSNNQISKIHDSTFSGLPNLKNVYLDSNKFATLSYKIFENLNNLQILDLLGNTCINQKFGFVNGNLKELEVALENLCGTGNRLTDKEMIARFSKEISEHIKENVDLKSKIEKCEESQNKIPTDVSAKLEKMEKQLDVFTNSCGNCKNDLIASEIKSTDNYMSLFKTLQDDKITSQEVSKQLLKTCKQKVSDLESVMKKVAKTIEDRLRKVEQKTQHFGLDHKMNKNM